MNPQYVTIEKDPAPMYVSRPWRVVCHDGAGPFKPHVTAGFHTKRHAKLYAVEIEKIIAQDLMK